MEYLVKYANKSIADATWVKEAHFTTTDLIETYWENTSSPENNTVNIMVASNSNSTFMRNIRRLLSTILLLSCIHTSKTHQYTRSCDSNRFK